MDTDRSEVYVAQVSYKDYTHPDYMDNELWEHLSHLLRSSLRSQIYRANVLIWKGQEEDIIDDLVQTALLKILKYLTAARQSQTVIYSLERLSIVIAKRCFLDRRRHEIRLSHFSHDEVPQRGSISPELLVDPSREAEEKIHEEELLTMSARIIATFPAKLRQAILIDLAKNSYFDAQVTVLQRAFLDVGIQLQAYEQSHLTNQVPGNSQITLRNQAYKRLAQEIARKEAGESEPDTSVILNNTELTTLALHLKNTQLLVVAPPFQERLLSSLLQNEIRPLLPEHIGMYGTLYANMPPEVEDAEQAYPLCSEEPDVPEILGDQELTVLASQLRDGASLERVDPSFQEKLRQELLEIFRHQRTVQVSEEQRDRTVLDRAQIVRLVKGL